MFIPNRYLIRGIMTQKPGRILCLYWFGFSAVLLLIILHILTYLPIHRFATSNQAPTARQVDNLWIFKELLTRKPHWCRYLIDEVYFLQFLQHNCGVKLESRPYQQRHSQSGIIQSCGSNSIVLKSGQNSALINSKYRALYQAEVSQMMDVITEFKLNINLMCSYSLMLLFSPDEDHPNVTIYKLTETANKYLEGSESFLKYAATQCTAGASTFKVQVKGRVSRAYCNVHSEFNGDYFIICPVHEPGSWLKIHRTSLNFHNYFRLGHTVAIHVHSTTMPDPYFASPSENIEAYMREACALSSTIGYQPDSTNSSDRLPTSYQFDLAKTYSESRGLWIKALNGEGIMSHKSETWDYVLNGCPVRKLTKDQLHGCLSRINNLIIIGDSHMRYFNFYMRVKLGWADLVKIYPELPGYDFTGNIIHVGCRYTGELGERLDRLVEDLKTVNVTLNGTKEKPDVIVANSAHWDLEFGVPFNMTIGFEHALSAIERLLNRPQGHPEGYLHGYPQGHPQDHPQGPPQGNSANHPQDHPKDHQQGRPQNRPHDHLKGHPQNHPQGNSSNHAQDHPQGHPEGHPQSHPQIQPKGHLKGHSQSYSQDQLLSQGRLRVMWAGMVSMPDFSNIQDQTVMATIGWMYSRLAEIGVQIFDSHGILYPFNNRRAAGFHYIYVKPRESYVRATVGLPYVELLAASICR